MEKPISNLVVISDLHCGCQLALCPPRVRKRHGGGYTYSKFQKPIWECWKFFWNKWVPRATKGEPYVILLNGDAMDGRHHNSTNQITQDKSDQANIAYSILAPRVDKAQYFYYVSGTTVHAGEAGEDEEKLAERLGAIPDESGNYSRYEMYIKVKDALVHATHHIGTTGSMAYEATALTKEFTEFCSESARWGRDIPDVVVRSHRHRHIEVRVPTKNDYGIIFTSSGWQLKTPFLYRLPGGRTATPMIGGSLIRQGDEEHFTRHKTWETNRPRTEVPIIHSMG